MKDKKAFFIFVLVFVLLLGGAAILYRQLGQSLAPEQLVTQPTQPEGETVQKIKAPDFTVYDKSGNEVHLSDYAGKPIVLNFWASWCGPCKMEMPDFHAKYLSLGDEVQFLMINMTTGRETIESASSFIAQNGYRFPVFYDLKSDAALTYGTYSLPTTFFIDADGYAVAQVTGAINAEALQKGIDMIH